MTRAFVSLGSNLGDRKKNILEAVDRIRGIERTRLRRLSRLRATRPVGRSDQPPFLNAVAELDTELDPAALLDRLQGIESDLGRARAEHWGPRTIDLDLLLVGDLQMATPRLVLPHPRIGERRFVLEPLAELAPDLVLPGDDRTVRERLESLSEDGT